MTQQLCKKHRRPVKWFWKVCAIGKDEAVCDVCDLELNKIALKWRYPKTWRRRYEAYKRACEAV